MRDNYVNFATSTLASPNPLTITGLTLTVATGTGTLFPISNFKVTIDVEVIFITSRSGDTFTIATTGRGFDNSVAASHVQGALIQCSLVAYDFLHLWQDVPDTFVPDTPPLHRNLLASGYDQEFEAAGTAWTLTPAAGTGTTFNAGTTLKSMLVFNRGSTDATIYTAFVSLTLTAVPWMATCKVTCATDFRHNVNASDQGQFSLFAADDASPGGSADRSNRFRVDLVQSTANATEPLTVRAAKDVSSAFTQLGPSVAVAPGEVYLRIFFDGTNTWTAYFGDGVVFWPLATLTPFLPNTAVSLGLSFFNFIPSGKVFPQTFAIDFVRLVSGTGLNPLFGS